MSFKSYGSRKNDQPPVVDIRVPFRPNYKPMDGVKVVEPVMIRSIDAARALSINVKTLYKMIERGEGPPAIRIGDKPNSLWHFHYKTFIRWCDRLAAKAERAQEKLKHQED